MNSKKTITDHEYFLFLLYEDKSKIQRTALTIKLSELKEKEKT